ncbi:hypothetical protein SAMN05421823_104295 [Catalinimonas alkaloidigena]|uniref:Tetratricopeptide repeat-containing protein n=1 Tax=Catalinimonas alkaloidigena TaxID=1075417 RepID=A0A1G9H255_9BACT|nr:hypothetical protein [Catalinimonas alkaloidigena]SDL07036.1 hypothetical protein SAMN05421823_104295 [Catalinimonas alkaloidigena]
MKKTGIFLTLLVLVAHSALAQDFKATLEKTVTTFQRAQELQERLAASNRLELIANKFADQWAAPYYAAYSKALLGAMETDPIKKDQYLDQADQYLTKAQALTPDQDENFVLAAMIASTRIGVDPENRWQQYGKEFEQNLKKAKKLKEDNPRIYYLQGVSLLYTPEQFGGGKKAALPYFEKAATLFQQEPDDDITDPSWGEWPNTEYLKYCQS